jgi:hypothetical protein
VPAMRSTKNFRKVVAGLPLRPKFQSRLEDVKKSISKFAVNSAPKKIAPRCLISDRWDVGKHWDQK